MSIECEPGTSLPRRVLGKTGLNVSVLGFGSAEVGYLRTDFAEAAALLNLLLDSGVNLLDTAAQYPGAEELIGRAVGHRRDDYILVSKCGYRLPECDLPSWSPEVVCRTVDRALRNLRTDVLDVMLLHSCKLEVLQEGAALAALLRARDAGKVRFIGYAGDNQAAAYAATLPEVAVIETSVNLCDQANLASVLPVAAARDVGVLAKRAMANAAWKDLGEQRGMFQRYAATYTERLRKMHLTPGDVGLAIPAAEAWPELALRFTLSVHGVHSAIVGTTNTQNARRNLESAVKGPLSVEAVARVRAAFREADPDGVWTGST